VWRLLLVLLSALAGVGRTAIEPAPVAAGYLGHSSAAVGLVVSMPVSRGEGQRFLFRTERIKRGAEWRDESDVVYVSTRASRVNVGDRLWVTWKVETVEEIEPGFGGYVRSQGAVASAQVFTVRQDAIGSSWQRRFVQLRADLGGRLQHAAPGDAGALLAGMVTGDDGQLAKLTRDEFRVTQTSHITAVSGSNLSMVAGLWAILGASGWLRRRWWYQVLVVGTIAGYAILVGLEPPAVRAAIVTLLAVLSVRFGRRPDPLTLLVLTAAGMAVADPSVTSSLGFQLSVASSVALVACLPTVERGAIAWLRSTGLAVLCAQLATVPLLIAAFGSWSPIGIIANVLIAPLVPIATYLGALAAVAGLVWTPFGDVLGWLAAWPAEAILLVIHRCALVARPLPLAGAGRAGLAVITVIALAILGAMSAETRRFVLDVRDAWLATPADGALAAVACTAGFVLTVVALVALT
jgi:competence protein ComEC